MFRRCRKHQRHIFILIDGKLADTCDGAFSGTNGTTLAVYAALGAALFMVVLELQIALGYSALEAGAALVPVDADDAPLAAGRGARATDRPRAADDDRAADDRASGCSCSRASARGATT